MGNEHAGKNFLLKIDTGGGVFTTLGGLRSKTWTHENEEIDVSNHGSNNWKERLFGLKSLTISGSGLSKNEESVNDLKTAARQQNKIDFQLTDGDETIEGTFLVTSLEITGEFNGAVEYSLTAVSDGEITVT